MAGMFSPASERMSDTSASVQRSGLPARCGRGVGEGGGGAPGAMDLLGAEVAEVGEAGGGGYIAGAALPGACGTTKGFLHTGQLVCWPE